MVNGLIFVLLFMGLVVITELTPNTSLQPQALFFMPSAVNLATLLHARAVPHRA